MYRRLAFLVTEIVVASSLSCGRPLPLPEVDPRVDELCQKVARYCFDDAAKGEDPSGDLLEFKNIMDEAYQGQPTPQTEEDNLKLIDSGYEIDSYPPDEGLAGAIVARPLPASLDACNEALFWDDQMEVFTDRYSLFERTIDEGDKDSFLSGSSDFIAVTDHVIDLGQQNINFEYDSYKTFTRYKGKSLPEEGVILECTEMIGEAERVSGGYNAYMDKLHAVHIYYPIDGENTYRIVASWVLAGGSFWIFGSKANSGNVGKGIIDEFTGFTNFLTEGRRGK